MPGRGEPALNLTPGDPAARSLQAQQGNRRRDTLPFCFAKQDQQELRRDVGIGKGIVACIALDTEFGQPVIQRARLPFRWCCVRKQRRRKLRRIQPAPRRAQSCCRHRAAEDRGIYEWGS